MAEYLNMIVVSLLMVTFFLGGWWLPFGIEPPEWVYPIVVLAKMLIFVSSSSGSGRRCRGRATTSSCPWAGRCCSRSRRSTP